MSASQSAGSRVSSPTAGSDPPTEVAATGIELPSVRATRGTQYEIETFLLLGAAGVVP